MAAGLGCSTLCVLGHNGDVLHPRFTRGESFNEVSDIFRLEPTLSVFWNRSNIQLRFSH